MSADIVRKVKGLKHQAYNQYSGEIILKQLDELTEGDAGLVEVLGIVDKQGYTDRLFKADQSDLSTAEGFVHDFMAKLIAKFPEDTLEHLAEHIKKSNKELSFSKICVVIHYLSKANFKNHPATFSKICTEMLFLADTFYRVVFEIFYFKGQQLGETEQKVLLKSGYLKTSSDITAFIKNNKKILEFSTGKFTALKVSDFVGFDGENIEKYNSVSQPQLNTSEFLKLVGNLTARMDIVRHFLETNPDKDIHQVVQFKDIRDVLNKLNDKVHVDPLAIVEAESGFFQYRKYHVLSLRKDKIFNLHKNIVVNTDQEDEHLAPADECWEGYGGLYALYLIRSQIINERGLYSLFTPLKLAKLIMHAICNVPENTYTSGDYFLIVLQFLQKKLQRSDFGVFADLNQDNAFWYDTFVALKRIDFNIKPTKRPIVTDFFRFMLQYVEECQTRFILVTKFLDMDYVETFFQTSSMSIGVLQILSEEIETAKYNAFSQPEIFLKKEQIEKIWGHIQKGDHKQLGMLREGLKLFFGILKTLKDFNAADWVKENTLKEFYMSVDPTAFDPIKESLLNRVAECKEIVDRKQKGLFTGEMAKVVDEEMGVSEYWVVDVQKSQIYAFEILDRGSKRIDNSLVLPGLSIETITTALNLSKEQDQSQIGKWLMSEFQT